MASLSIDNEEIGNKGRMWALQQQLDPPMDEDGGGLRNRYDEKVYDIILCNSWFMEIDSNLNQISCSLHLAGNRDDGEGVGYKC